MEKSILFVKHLNSSFIRRDETLLAQKHRVQPYYFVENKGWRVIPGLIRQFFSMLALVPKSKLIFIWFADFHAVIPAFIGRLLKRKVIIVVGGVDASCLPEYRYGTKTKLLGNVSVRISTKLANRLLPVSHFTKNALLRNVSPRLGEKSQIVYNCFDAAKSLPARQQKERVVTVCLAQRVNTLFIKGVDFFVEVARSLPAISFSVIGPHGDAYDYLMQNKPENLQIIQPIPYSELQEVLSKSLIICQFSRHEAFGLALLEGIAAGCFPIGYDYGGTAEILQNTTGTLISGLNVEEAADRINWAIAHGNDSIENIQNQVLPRFSCCIRQKQLEQIIEELTASS